VRTVDLMARRKTKRRSRRRFNGINLWNAAEGLVQANIITQNWFDADPLAFLIGHNSQGYGGHASGGIPGAPISLMELVGFGEADGAANRAAAWNNIKSSWMPVVTQSIAARAGFFFAKKLTRGMRRDTNKMIKMVGLQNEVKV